MESSKITKWLKVITFLLVIIIAQNAFIQKTTYDANSNSFGNQCWSCPLLE